jgi:hypothetical protein
MVILPYLNTNMFLFSNFFLYLHPFLYLVIIEEVDLSCFYLAQMNAKLVDSINGDLRSKQVRISSIYYRFI